ncbi:Protein TPX2 [Camellia lanceoleosa]|uniref:Protein TPX2 n=1 Tax=Camellia lanceoleosa TaxID=1840588 RepID=A0ACC0G8Y9_9ERIC|nr:Protein TPX2 [Camellia lanceoleosa]
MLMKVNVFSEAPSLLLPKRSTPRLPEFQEFHLKMVERAMQHTSAVSSPRFLAVILIRTVVSPPIWGYQAKLPGNFSNSWTRQEQPAVLPYDSRKKICNQECGCSGRKKNQPFGGLAFGIYVYVSRIVICCSYVEIRRDFVNTYEELMDKFRNGNANEQQPNGMLVENQHEHPKLTV